MSKMHTVMCLTSVDKGTSWGRLKYETGTGNVPYYSYLQKMHTVHFTFLCTRVHILVFCSHLHLHRFEHHNTNTCLRYESSVYSVLFELNMIINTNKEWNANIKPKLNYMPVLQRRKNVKPLSSPTKVYLIASIQTSCT
jgi:hypothetical protein